MRHIIVIALAVILMISQATARKPAGQPQKAQLQGKLSSVKTQISDVRSKLRQTKQRERKISVKLEHTEHKLHETRTHLGTTRNRLAAARLQRDRQEARLAEITRRLHYRRSLLSRRVRASYEMGNTSYVSALATSRNVNDLLSRGYVIRRIAMSDAQLVQSIRQDQEAADAERRRLEATVAEIGRLERALQGQAQTLKVQTNEQQALLKQVKTQREAYEQALNELEAMSRHIAAALRAMEQTAAGRRRSAVAFKGGFLRPVSGPVTSAYGMRFHPILRYSKLHTGVDFGASYGAPIRAAASGVVVHVGYMRAYGNTVIIDHGGSVSTLYGHCSSLLVRHGQEVKQGDTIARVGSTGFSTGPHLHFEVRRHGDPVRPPW